MILTQRRQGDLFENIETLVKQCLFNSDFKFRIAELAFAGNRNAAVVLKRVKDEEARFNSVNLLEDL